MKVIFEFDRYEDAELIEIHNNAEKKEIAINDFDQYLRQINKHGEEQFCKEVLDEWIKNQKEYGDGNITDPPSGELILTAIQMARTKLWELLNEKE